MLNNKEQITWILFALVIIAVYFFALDLPLLGPDEPRYSQVAREMFERNDWITTKLGNYNWFEKPALLYWLQIFFYNIFGVNEFAARFGSALFGIGTVASLWILGRRVSPETDFSNWLMIISATSIGLMAFARGASFDIIITFPMCASLVSFFIWENSTESSNQKTSYLALILFYFFIGVSLIGKGLIGMVFPFAIVAFYYVLRWKIPNKVLLLSLVWGTLVSILVASTWYLPMYLRNGWEFIDEFIIQHHFKRFTSNEYKHPGPFWFFFAILPAMTIPWIPFFLVSVWKFLKSKFKREEESQELINFNSRLVTFAAAWILVPLVFFSFSGSKLPGYILPVLPAACILTGIFVYQFIQKNPSRKYLIQILAFLTFVVVIVLLRFAVPEFAKLDSTKHFVDIANSKGFESAKIINMHTINHNIEFYGSGRVLRAKDGKLKRVNGTKDLLEYLDKKDKDAILVIIPHEFLDELTKSDILKSEVLAKNSELTFVAVQKK